MGIKRFVRLHNEFVYADEIKGEMQGCDCMEVVYG